MFSQLKKTKHIFFNILQVKSVNLKHQTQLNQLFFLELLVTLQICFHRSSFERFGAFSPAASRLDELILFTNWVSGFMTLCEPAFKTVHSGHWVQTRPQSVNTGLHPAPNTTWKRSWLFTKFHCSKMCNDIRATNEKHPALIWKNEPEVEKWFKSLFHVEAATARRQTLYYK